MANCGRCLYGVVYPEGVRRCCRYAPAFSGGQGATAFQKVEDWEWCGDFAAVAPPAPGLPVIMSVNPTTGTRGVINMTVTGENFTADAVVLFGGIQQQTTVVSSTTLTSAVNAGRGTFSVVVRTVAGDSNGVQFIVN